MLLKRLVPLCLAFSLSAPMAHAEGDTADNFNFRFGPIVALIGVLDIGLDIVVHPNWTIGPEFTYLKWSLTSSSSFDSNYEITGLAIGGRANFYPDGVFSDGLYISPILRYVNVKVVTSDTSGEVTGEASPLIATGLVGYAWFWDSFNMHLGGGLSLPMGDSKVKVRNTAGNDDEVEFRRTGALALEFNLGWTF